MKKIFSVLSLIAILTIFSTEAVANDTDVGVEYVASFDSPDLVSVAVVEVPTVIEFINVADSSVNYIASEGGVDIPDIVAGLSATSSTNYAKVFLPFEVGLLETPNLNEYVSKFNYTYGSEAPEIVSRISSNIGKFTKYNI
jgi:hypothetical protein